jgi:hypothetical protein
MLLGQASAADLALRDRPTRPSQGLQRTAPLLQIHEGLYREFLRWRNQR